MEKILKILSMVSILTISLGCKQSLEFKSSFDKTADADKSKNKIKNPLDLKIRKVVGELRKLVVDYKDKATEVKYFLVSKSGETFDLGSEDENLNKLPLNKFIELPIKDSSDSKKVEIEFNRIDLRKFSQMGIDSLDVEKDASGREIKNIGLYFIKYKDVQPWGEQENIDERATYIKKYFKKISHGKWKVTVKAHYVQIGITRDECIYGIRTYNCQNDYNDAVSAYIRKKDLSHNYHSIIYDFSNSREPKCGEAYVGGSINWNWCASYHTLLHELGHNFGLSHSSAWSPDKIKIIEYGDNSSVMGSTSFPEINAYESVLLGVNHENSTLRLKSTEQVFLAPIEWELSDLYGGIKQIAHVSNEKNPYGYYISIRANEAPYVVKDYYKNLVFVHRRYGGSLIEAMLAEGEEFNSPQVKVQFIALKNGIAKVNIYHNPSEPEPKDRDFPENRKRVLKSDLKIYSSKVNMNGPDATEFTLNEDTIYWKVKNAGPNALACAEYEAQDGSRGNLGNCDDFDNFKIMNESKKWRFNEKYKVWVLVQDLTEKTPYIPGKFIFHWFNPDTDEIAEKKITIYK
jgi:hypothetical protein